MADSPLAPATIAWGCTFTPAQVGPGQIYFKLLHAEGPMEWGGRISTFIEVLDMAGQRLVDIPVLWWNGGEVEKKTEPKPGDPFALDIPMYAKHNSYGVKIADGDIPSDSIFGMGLAEHGPHQVFKLVFQLSVAGAVGTPGPTPPDPEPPLRDMTALEALFRAQTLISYALGRLGA